MKAIFTTALTACLIAAFTADLSAQTISPYLLVDQFGYLPASQKIAVIKDPVQGYDAEETFAPGATYALIDADGEQIWTGSPQAWKAGATDDSSGDRVWHVDFSEVQENGTYYLLDVDQNVRSYSFSIGEAVYGEILKQAVRTFFYQRAGFAKMPPFADPAWADIASHLGPLQDTEARLYSNRNSAATARDLHGGWYDAGDYNKYTSWTANYVVDMMKAYLENPAAWADNYNLPESGNGIPDLLDEARWGLDFLLRMQQTDGSVLSIVSLSHASPPSSATGPSLYGPATTSATQNTASAFAIASVVFREIGSTEYAGQLLEAARKAWTWSGDHPAVLFYNNDANSGSSGIGAGQQEEDDYTRAMGRLEAACYLFEATGEEVYREYFDSHYRSTHLFEWTYAYPFETNTQEVLLRYTQIPGATAEVVQAIKDKYGNTMGSEHNFTAYFTTRDPYLAYLKDYTWGSNGIKAAKGSMFYNLITYQVDPSREAYAYDAAQNYIHYLHGVNPNNLAYLSNMYAFGGDRTVNEFYHTWFHNGSALWDRVGDSTYGPAPGFVTGGPNPSYNWDGCCPGGCGSAANNAICTSEELSPPRGQPRQKAYRDFNTSWPLNSWSVTENSGGYQMAYIRLLSKFVNAAYDCNNVLDGTAYVNSCGTCVGGNTGLEDDPNCQPTATREPDNYPGLSVSPNPTTGLLQLNGLSPVRHSVQVFDLTGRLIKTTSLLPGEDQLTLQSLPSSIYWIRITNEQKQTTVRRVVKVGN
jgi:hypothetical protein